MPISLSVMNPDHRSNDEQLRSEVQCLRRQLAEAQNKIVEQARVVELAKELLQFRSKLSRLDDAILELDGSEW
ncbi:hypothetical protein [Lacipirellula limnantheis]|uniref:Uncharacterized protein n=1 Tax=Lacipirellula limnantheis TaxID=2528024 RepID=A0A517TYD8_9BACT|nr:hypothetical protein [Lacipirellula limnantheis]QDT73393.1 hypothetical protein I41_25820 [Lacipirellula limnantheis]